MTLIIIIVTCIISIVAFSKREWMVEMQFNPWSVYHRKQYYRLLSHGFLHADWIHLFVNMFVLYSFGSLIEQYFHFFKEQNITHFPVLNYLFLYVSAIVISSLTTLKKHKEDVWYNAVGASGAVSAIVFTSIFLDPWNKLYFFAIIPIPGIVFGALYLAYTHYMSKKSNDNINHDAHFIGAVYGFFYPLLIDPKLFWLFFNQLVSLK